MIAFNHFYKKIFSVTRNNF